MTTVEFLRIVPKTELHMHIEAAVTADTYMMLNERHGIDSALDSTESIKKLLDIASLSDMIQNFITFQTFFQTEEDYALMVEDVRKYAQANSIKYCETHFAISLPKRRGLDAKKVVLLLEEHLEKLSKEYGIDVKLIIDLSRTFGAENAFENLDLAIQLVDESPYNRIAGIGLGGAEKEGDVAAYQPVFEKARAHGLHCVAHAGEAASSKNIVDAVSMLRAERIGHGISAIHDPNLMAQLRDMQTPIEISMTSNLLTKEYVEKVEDHPVRRFFEEGLNVCINSDDPFIFDTTLTEELIMLHEKLDFSVCEIIGLLTNAIDSSFMPDESKHRLKNELHTFTAKWFGSLHL